MGFKVNLMKIILVFIVLSLTTNLYAQTSDFPLPFKSGHVYGIVNQAGKELLPAAFQEVRILTKYNIILLNKNGFWGVYNLKGVKIIDHILEASNVENSNIPIVKFARTKDNVTSINLLEIIDQNSNLVYYVNPFSIIKNYKAYVSNQVDLYHKNHIDYSKLVNLYKVRNKDKTVNFIDSTGTELFPESFDEGILLNEPLLGIIKDKKLALYEKKKKLTNYTFNTNVETFSHSLCKLSKTVNQNNGKNITWYFCYGANGKLIDSSSVSIYVRDGLVISNKTDGFSVYDNKGKKLFEHAGYQGEFIKIGEKQFIKTSRKYHYGLMKLDGEEIINPDHNFFSYHKDYHKIITKQDQTITLFDSLFNPLFTMEGAEDLILTDIPSWYVFTKKYSSGKKYGLINNNHKILLNPVWNEIYVAKHDSLVMALNDSVKFIFRIGQDNPIMKVHKDEMIRFNINEIERVVSRDTVYIYDQHGNFINSLSSKEEEMKKKHGVIKFKKSGSGNNLFLVDMNGNRLTHDAFSEILIIHDKVKNNSIYICQFADDDKFSCKVLNDDLEVATPDGYSLFPRSKLVNLQNPGTLKVYNETEFKQNSDFYQTGICDYNGNWIIKPFYGFVEYSQKGLFIIYDRKEHVYKFYNEKGEKTCSQTFFKLVKNNEGYFEQNRLLASNLVNQDDVKKLKSLKLEEQSLYEARNLLKQFDEVPMTYSFINEDGELVLNGMYVKAKPFSKSDTKTTVVVSGNGHLKSQIIDTTGSVLLELDYEDVEIVDTHHYKAKKGEHWALLDSTGQALTPFQFDEITAIEHESIFLAKNNDGWFLIASDYEVLPLGAYHKVQVRKKGIYFVVECHQKNEKTNQTNYIFRIYNDDLFFLRELTDILYISDEFYEYKLPPGYLVTNTNLSPKNSFIYDIVNNKFLAK